MSYLSELTEQYHIIQRNLNQDITVNGSLEAYFSEKQPSDFCNAVFVAGYEMRDETNVPHDMLKRGIDIIQRVYETKKDVIENNNKLYCTYQLGLTGHYLGMCPSTEVTAQTIKTYNLEELVFNLKKSLIILNEIIDKAEGILKYQVIKQFEYAFKLLDNIKVDNNNLPPDLDSMYVFTDQLNNDNIWYELIRQLRAKFSLIENIAPEVSVTSDSLASKVLINNELNNVINNLEETKIEVPSTISAETTIPNTLDVKVLTETNNEST